MATNNSANIATGAASTVLQGAGVGTAPTFTATPAVTSFTLGAGTALANYIEGTWTPVVNFGGGTTGIVYNGQSGTYRRIGNTVFIYCFTSITNVGSSTGVVTITGLPITSASNSSNFSIAINQFQGITFLSTYSTVSASVDNYSTQMTINKSGTGLSTVNLTNAVANDVIAATFVFSFSGSYIV